MNQDKLTSVNSSFVLLLFTMIKLSLESAQKKGREAKAAGNSSTQAAVSQLFEMLVYIFFAIEVLSEADWDKYASQQWRRFVLNFEDEYEDEILFWLTDAADDFMSEISSQEFLEALSRDTHLFFELIQQEMNSRFEVVTKSFEAENFKRKSNSSEDLRESLSHYFSFILLQKMREVSKSVLLTRCKQAGDENRHQVFRGISEVVGIYAVAYCSILCPNGISAQTEIETERLFKLFGQKTQLVQNKLIDLLDSCVKNLELDKASVCRLEDFHKLCESEGRMMWRSIYNWLIDKGHLAN